MTRRNFTAKTRLAAIKRATDAAGVIRCEKCGGEAKRAEVDHINPDALTGGPGLDNAMLLCRPCHVEKTRGDVKVIAKAKRREAKHVGAVPRKQPIQSPGFPAKPVNADRLPLPPRRSLYAGRSV